MRQNDGHDRTSLSVSTCSGDESSVWEGKKRTTIYGCGKRGWRRRGYRMSGFCACITVMEQMRGNSGMASLSDKHNPSM